MGIIKFFIVIIVTSISLTCLANQKLPNEINGYIGQEIITGMGNRMGSGMVNVGGLSVGKDRVKLYFIDYTIDILTNEKKPIFFRNGLIDHREIVLNCKDKTYSSYTAKELHELANAPLSYHELGHPHKWGDYDFKDDGYLGVQYKDDQEKVTKLFNFMCDSGIK
ncbi:hypothetical protein CE143_14750 [Photorhabdus luminescens]|uniref:Uncharacterized protein n=1 Tax=Photorhabdus akhurstii TaxID=171438 RepID=A0ABX8LVE5_9GAMM|nr:hypothetical protein [Photorhabdus akhurstii]QXF34267.1 hypothetical protein B0X70_14755 [Photorhabdus akhurstii]UJD76090.1 hypothetical protein CE143_14750 [Photorhabdus luminescens]